jgi:putative thioredoxin
MNGPTPSASKWIVSTTREAFHGDVFERSQEVPVVVDFWAQWCAPCRLLGPMLESLAEEYQGRFVLVKADTDQLPEAAAAFQVQSIPAVFGVVGGEVVDGFAGALPEVQIREWLDRVLLSGRLTEAAQLEADQPQQAEARYRQVLEENPKQASASIGLARVLVSQGKNDEAGAILEQLEARGFLEPEAEAVKASLQLQDNADVDVDACRQAAASAPDDLQLRFTLAEALAGDGQYQEALDICLDLVERDRHGVGERARQVMVDIFRVLPHDSELVPEYRRKLAMLLY